MKEMEFLRLSSAAWRLQQLKKARPVCFKRAIATRSENTNVNQRSSAAYGVVNMEG